MSSRGKHYSLGALTSSRSAAHARPRTLRVPFHSPSPRTEVRGCQASRVSTSFPSPHLDYLHLDAPPGTMATLDWDPTNQCGLDPARLLLRSAVLLRSRQMTVEMRVNSWPESRWCPFGPRRTQRGRCGRPTCHRTNRLADPFGCQSLAPLVKPEHGLARSGLRPGTRAEGLCACPSPVGRRHCCLRVDDGADSGHRDRTQSAETKNHRHKPILA